MSTPGRRPAFKTDPTESSPLLASTPSAARSGPRNDDYGHDEADLTHFPPGSPLNPRNWPSWRKWLIVAAITPTDLSVSWAASGFSPAEGNFADEFGVGEEVARLGLSLYVLGIALGPMFLAPLSEVLGRNSMYTGPYATFLVLLACTALAPSVPVFMVLRFFSGLFAAVTVANFGGTIADLWPHAETGRAMSVYLWAATCGSPSGFFFLSAVAQHHGWRTVFWTILTMNSTCWVLMTAALWGNETRHTTILRREARRIASLQDQEREQESGVGTGAGPKLPVTPGRRSIREIAHVALTRPFRFLFTEAIVIFGALYNGFLYGLSFLFNVAFVQVFGRDHGFSTFGVGCAFLGIVAGISTGPLTNLWQERHYRRAVRGGLAGAGGAGGANAPEARVQLSKIAALVLPASLFWFAWTTGAGVPAGAAIAAGAFWGWSFYTLILMTFQYTEDSYRVFSASALAGIALVRNVAGAAFPLFGPRVFAALGGPRWAVSLLALLALLMAPIPFVLERRGFELRKRSPWARQHVGDLDDGDAEG